MLKRSVFTLLFIVFMGAVIWGGDVLGDRQYRADVIGAAPLYSLPPHEYPSSNPFVSMLRPGEHLRVLRVRYGKDFEALKVETEDGHVGWVIGGEGIKVVPVGSSLVVNLSLGKDRQHEVAALRLVLPSGQRKR